MNIRAFGLSDRGIERGEMENEDSFGYFPEERSGPCPDNNIYVLADGMGGAIGGGLASTTAVETVRDFFAKGLQISSDLIPKGKDPISNRLRYSILKAHNRLRKMIFEDSKLKGMGTTIVAVHFENNKVYVAHVGDSRCYRIRRGKIEMLTKDHSLVQNLYDNGKISLDEMKTHPKRSVITRALGADSGVECDIRIEPLKNDDIFVLCSDGLNREVRDEEIRDIVLKESNPEIACKRLIELANLKGGHDNVTVIVLRVSNVVSGRKPIGIFNRFWKKETRGGSPMKINPKMLSLLVLIVSLFQILGCATTTGLRHAISAKIVDKDTGEGIKDVTVRLLDNKNNEVFSDQTNEEGEVRITHIKRAKYTLSCAKKGILPPISKEVDLVAKGSESLIIPVEVKSAIRGRLITPSDTPISQATVRVFREDNVQVDEDWSKDNGEFFFKGIDPGEYILRIEHPEYLWVETLPFAVMKADETRLDDIRLKPISEPGVFVEPTDRSGYELIKIEIIGGGIHGE